ncbi:MAG: response regulator [Synergistaceae bacterium]|jgi:CheY-like chemotaxis protein|nr:response regulator [Synergistaceae bacterium]
MFDLFFGKYLLEKKFITLPRLRSMLERLKKVRVRLGVLAIHAGLLTGEQVDNLAQMQRREDISFGRLAVREGLLTSDQVFLLLEEQSRARFSLGQLLVDDGIFTYEELEKIFNDYKQTSELTSFELDALHRNDMAGVLGSFFHSSEDDTNRYGACASFFLKNVIRFISDDVQFERMQSATSFTCRNFIWQQLTENDFSSGISQNTENGFICGLEGEASSLLAFSRLFMPVMSVGLDEVARDALSEFLNLQNGLYLSWLSEKGMEMRPSPVEFRKDVEVTGSSVLWVPFSIAFGKYNIVMAVRPEFKNTVVPKGNRRERILVTDDSAISRIMLEDILTRGGYEIAGEAADGETAIQKYQEIQPDLVTLDITMPKKSGLDALQSILQMDPDARIVMITALAQNSSILQALRQGAMNYILKPFDEETVLSVIDDALTHRI